MLCQNKHRGPKASRSTKQWRAMEREKDREGREGGPTISIMPLGSELECWPDSLSTGAQSLRGGLGSEMGQREQRGSQWKRMRFSGLNHWGAKIHSRLLMADPPLALTFSLLHLLFLATFIFRGLSPLSLWICWPMAWTQNPSSQFTL